MLNELIKLADILDKNGSTQASDIIDDMISKFAAKKSKKRRPTNRKLWSRAISEAKKKFKVYPCVPVDISFALTRTGWSEYSELNVGDEIVTYNIKEDRLEWDKIKDIHFYSDADIIRVKDKNESFNFLCTEDHKWVISSHDKRHLVRSWDLYEEESIVTTSSMSSFDGEIEKFYIKELLKYTEINTIDHLLKLVEDGLILKFNQDSILDAILSGCSILGIRAVRKGNILVLFKENMQTVKELTINKAGKRDVWCPETENGTWLMKQNNMVTITGNSAYANGWAAKWYKERGGGWRGPKRI
jgi:hypothetical protein